MRQSYHSIFFVSRFSPHCKLISVGQWADHNFGHFSQGCHVQLSKHRLSKEPQRPSTQHWRAALLAYSWFWNNPNLTMLEITQYLTQSIYGIRRSAKHTIPSDQSINRLWNKQTDAEKFLVLSRPLTIEHLRSNTLLQCNIFFWNLACDQRNPKYYEREHVVGQLARTMSHPHILRTALLVYQFRVFFICSSTFRHTT